LFLCSNLPPEGIVSPQSRARTGLSSSKEPLRDIQENNFPKEHKFWFPSRPTALEHAAYATVNISGLSRAKSAIMVELLYICPESKEGIR
jgi:hypothetical protein